MLARNLPGICSEFARNLLGTRSSLGICSEFARKTARTSHVRNSPTELWGENSVSSSRPIICLPKRTHRVFRRSHRVCPKTQWGSVSYLLRNSTLETLSRYHFLEIHFCWIIFGPLAGISGKSGGLCESDHARSWPDLMSRGGRRNETKKWSKP